MREVFESDITKITLVSNNDSFPSGQRIRKQTVLCQFTFINSV